MIVGLRDVYQQEDDASLIQKIADLREKIEFSAEKKHFTAKQAIRALTEKIDAGEKQIELDRKAMIREKLGPMETKNTELSDMLASLSLQDQDILKRVVALEAREKDLMEAVKNEEENADVEERRLRNTVSLYANSCSVAWDRNDANTVYCTLGGATSVRKVVLDADATDFENATKLWDLMASA